MPNLHVRLLQVVAGLVVVVAVVVVVAKAAPCRHQATGAFNDAVSFNRHQGQVGSSKPGFDISYLDAAAAPLATPPGSGFRTDQMERWEDGEFADEEMGEELERWYEQWGESHGYEDNNDDNDYYGDDEDNDFVPYPITTYNNNNNNNNNNNRHLFFTKRMTEDGFQTLYPLTASLFHTGIPPPPPATKQTKYPPPRPQSSHSRGTAGVLDPALSSSSFANTLTAYQARALVSLHRRHVAQFAALNSRFRAQVAAVKQRHARNIADILGVPAVEVGRSGRPRHVDLGEITEWQMRELADFSQFVEFELSGMLQWQMWERKRLLEAQRGEWEGLRRELGAKAAVVGGVY